ncbi:MAG: methyltransferase domain-containing protein [Planctomycetes bacterium]|nr:methyltransferase domain-containing protein [Planctomycetota bacterium]
MRLDYDRIAEGYDAQPYRNKSADPDLAEFLRARPDLGLKGPSVLDAGCGTGNQLVANRPCWPHARFAGLDPFRGMLRSALSKSRDIAWIRGDGADLPFHSATFDFAINQFSFHHVMRKRRMLGEIRRVLRPGGRFVMSNIDPWAMADSPLYAYFPEALEADRRDFMKPAAIEEGLREAGFPDVVSSSARLPVVQTLRQFAGAVRERASCSQLLTISDEAYQAGLRRLGGDLSRPGGAEGKLESAVVLIRIRADAR